MSPSLQDHIIIIIIIKSIVYYCVRSKACGLEGGVISYGYKMPS